MFKFRTLLSYFNSAAGASKTSSRYRNGAFFYSALVGVFVCSSALVQAAPKVASINACTDQLVMLLADKEQVTSISFLSLDPKVSYLADEAAAYPLNYGRAEEIFMQKPDLVLAGSFTATATVDLLRRLGFQVEEFKPAETLADIRMTIQRIGELLEQPARAQKLIAEMDQSLTSVTLPQSSKTIALYYANNYTSGRGSMMDTVVRQAGFTNIADQLSLTGYGQLPLELLVMQNPDYLLMGERYAGSALAYQNFEHPALEAIKKQAVTVTLPDNLTVCGGPFTVEAVKILSDIVHD